jgi:predicted membrane-bound dolichyl-phosphate-mannose-protein mannosyltransferase
MEKDKINEIEIKESYQKILNQAKDLHIFITIKVIKNLKNKSNTLKEAGKTLKMQGYTQSQIKDILIYKNKSDYELKVYLNQLWYL